MGFVIPAKRAITPIFDQSFEITDGLLVLGVRMNLCEQQAEPGEMPRISMAHDFPFGAFAIHLEQIKFLIYRNQPFL